VADIRFSQINSSDFTRTFPIATLNRAQSTCPPMQHPSHLPDEGFELVTAAAWIGCAIDCLIGLELGKQRREITIIVVTLLTERLYRPSRCYTFG
jgi:hypothetical protein